MRAPLPLGAVQKNAFVVSEEFCVCGKGVRCIGSVSSWTEKAFVVSEEISAWTENVEEFSAWVEKSFVDQKL